MDSERFATELKNARKSRSVRMFHTGVGLGLSVGVSKTTWLLNEQRTLGEVYGGDDEGISKD